MALDWKLINSKVLNSINFDSLLHDVKLFNCNTYGDKVRKLLAENETHWTQEQRECLKFVGCVLSMYFLGKGELGVMVPADFPKENLQSLQEWAISLKNPELRARFLNVIWIQTHSFPSAKKAVKAYLESALSLEKHLDLENSSKNLERALRLSKSLGKGEADLQSQVLSSIDAMLQRHGNADIGDHRTALFLISKLIELLLEFKHGDAKQFAEIAIKSAKSAEKEKIFFIAHGYYKRAIKCYKSIKDRDGKKAAMYGCAESLVKEAEAQKLVGNGMATISLLSDMVQEMRQEDEHELAKKFHKKLLSLQECSEELLKFNSKEIKYDISDFVKHSEITVRGKPFDEAVYALCRIVEKPPSVEKLKSDVLAPERDKVFNDAFYPPSPKKSFRGRVIALIPALEAGADDHKNDKSLRFHMFTDAGMSRGIMVKAKINVAREEILTTHEVSESDIQKLIQSSPWIAPGHEKSVLRTLLAGFHNDMIIAGHMVPIQLEALIRHVVESRGGVTTMLAPDGTQQEKPLSTLLETTEAREAFGEDGVFELEDLLIDPLGANLRNEVAHGLLDDSGLFQDNVVYAWWLLLKFCVFHNIEDWQKTSPTSYESNMQKTHNDGCTRDQ